MTQKGKCRAILGDFVRRYYDRNLVHATPGTLQHALWETMEAWAKIHTLSLVSRRLQKLKITNRTFGLPLLEGNFCESECFYDGLRIGITNFLPQRFLLENPYDDREKPLLLVDVYRFGFLLGADIGTDFPSRFGIDRPLNDDMPQLRYQKVYEFIKVKSLDTIVDSVKNLGELSPLQVLKYRNIHLQLIENMQPGETLIASTYLSKGAGLEIGNYPFMGRPLLNAGVDFEHVVVSRKALMRNEDKFLLQFSDLKANKFWAGVKGEFLLTDFPLMALQLEKLSKMDLLFEVPASSEHHALLERGVASSLPADDMHDFAIAERSIENTKRKFSSILKPAAYFFDEADMTTIKMSGTDAPQELHIASVSEEKDTNLRIYSSHNTKLESFVTKDEQVFVKLNMHYEHYFGKRKHFAWVYKNMLPLLGKKFILFTPEDVNYYLDEFEFIGEVYVLPEGMEKIVAYRRSGKQALCVAYAGAAGELHPQQWCDKLFAKRLGTRTGRGRIPDHEERKFRNFLRLYVKAVNLWPQAPHDNMSAKEREKLLRGKAQAIAKLFSANSFNAAVWKMLQRIAGEDNIYRDGVLTSRTGGFPAQSKVVAMPEAIAR